MPHGRMSSPGPSESAVYPSIPPAPTASPEARPWSPLPSSSHAHTGHPWPIGSQPGLPPAPSRDLTQPRPEGGGIGAKEA